MAGLARNRCKVDHTGAAPKLVTAVAALRLVQQSRLHLDEDVNAELVSWHIPENNLTRGHPVTLRGLLSMTAGIGVPRPRMGARMGWMRRCAQGIGNAQHDLAGRLRPHLALDAG